MRQGRPIGEGFGRSRDHPGLDASATLMVPDRVPGYVPMREEHSAGAVVARHAEDGWRYLLLEYRGGHWGHVKGHIEQGESIEETIRREATEETGLRKLSFVDGFEEEIAYVFRRGADTVHKTVVFRLATTDEREVEVAAPEEHTDVDWFTYDEARDRITFDDARGVLEAAHAHLTTGEQASLDAFDG